MNEIRKSTQDLDEKVRNMEEKFIKEIGLMIKKETMKI
jgi:hypothetical protein